MNNDVKLQITNCQLTDVAALVFGMPTVRLQLTPYRAEFRPFIEVI